jgi:hypothetical protein
MAADRPSVANPYSGGDWEFEKTTVRIPAMVFEQRIIIGTAISRCALPANSFSEHSAQGGPIDVAALNAESDNATGELIHDDQHPVALCDEQQPRWPRSARRWAIVLRQDMLHNVVVDVDAESPRDNQGNAWATGTRVAEFQLDDGAYERIAGPLGPGFFGR